MLLIQKAKTVGKEIKWETRDLEFHGLDRGEETGVLFKKDTERSIAS